jgi:hypothetical protein
MNRQAFQLCHESYLKINLDYKISFAAPTSYSFLPNIKHAVFMNKSWQHYIDIFGNNPTTKNVGCKIYRVVEISSQSKWMISRKAFSTNRG